MNQLRQISPITDDQAERLVRPDTLADLAARITATPPGPAAGARAPARHRRRWLAGIPLAAALATAVLVIALTGRPAPARGPVPPRPARGPVQLGPAAAQALSFTVSDGYITVIVRNPVADVAWYNADFARHHLAIRLRLLPVSPSIVGTVVEFSETQGASPITPITAEGRCVTGGGGSACPVGLRIPEDFHGQAELVFGRAARPGEQYESSASAFAPGEVMHGMSVTGQPVARVLAELRARQVTVPVFNASGRLLRPAQVPGRWFVYDAVPWAPGQVMLFVGPTPAASPPAPGTPVASPSPASS